MIDTSLPRTLEETLDALDAKLENDNDTEGQRALMRHAREQMGKQDERIEALERERDDIQDELDNYDPPEWMFEDARNEAFANAARAATDLLLDVRRGLFTLDEAVERMHRLEDQ